MKKIAIHQPNFIPWTGYFYKLTLADVFVFLDDVQYTKNSYINRNQIKTPAGAKWLTIPVGKMPLQTPINKIEIKSNKELGVLLKTIQQNYARSKHFDSLFPKLKSVFLSKTCLLAEINIKLIKIMMEELQINIPLYRSSELKNIEGRSTDRLVSICKELNADHYISGYGGDNYQSAEVFKENEITVETYSFVHPEYKQLWGDFVSNLSIIDLIFNHGPQSAEILRNAPVKKKSLILSDEE